MLCACYLAEGGLLAKMQKRECQQQEIGIVERSRCLERQWLRRLHQVQRLEGQEIH